MRCASGTGLAYQWSKDGNALAGQTANTLVLNNVTAADAGNYTVTVEMQGSEYEADLSLAELDPLRPQFGRPARRRDVESAQHRAEQFGRLFARDHRTLLLAHGNGGEIGSLDLGGIVDAGRHAECEQFDQG
mgnify:CR=1 FL=1